MSILRSDVLTILNHVLLPAVTYKKEQCHVIDGRIQLLFNPSKLQSLFFIVSVTLYHLALCLQDELARSSSIPEHFTIMTHKLNQLPDTHAALSFKSHCFKWNSSPHYASAICFHQTVFVICIIHVLIMLSFLQASIASKLCFYCYIPECYFSICGHFSLFTSTTRLLLQTSVCLTPILAASLSNWLKSCHAIA